MAIIMGSVGAGRCGAGTVVESLYVTCKLETERLKLALVWAFETSKTLPVTQTPPTRPHPLILLKQFHQLGTRHSSISASGASLTESITESSGHLPPP